MTESKRPACVSVGWVGYIAVQVQAHVVCLATSTAPRDGAENSHQTVYTFFPIADAAKLSELLAKVAAIHAENFAPLPAVVS
jgi:hypothetical protein